MRLPNLPKVMYSNGMNAITRGELTQLLTGATIKPRLKRELRFVPEAITDWEARDFIAVTNKSHTEGVLVAPFEKVYIVPFHLQPRKANQLGRIEAIICDFCATWQRGSNSAVITFPKEKSSVTFLCCADLLCSLHVRDKTTASTLSRTQLREHNSIEDRVNRLKDRLGQIVNPRPR